VIGTVAIVAIGYLLRRRAPVHAEEIEVENI
jgi:hypothetical protein